MFTALADRSINIDCISTSEMKVSCIIAEKSLDDAARAIHAEFFGQAVTSESDEGGARRRTAKKPAKPAKPAAKRAARA
jgi:aspartate kinase